MNGALRSAWRLARKDLRLYVRDRSGLLLGIALPLMLVLVFGFVSKVAFGGGGGGMGRTTLWVLDRDDTAASRGFVAALRSVDLLRIRPDTDQEALSEEDLEAKVRDGDAHHALVMPQGFGAAFENGELPGLKLYRDPDRHLEAQLVGIGLAQATIQALGKDGSARLTARMLQLAGLPAEWADRILRVSEGFTVAVRGMFEEAEAEGLVGNEASAESDAASGAPSTDESTDGFEFQQILTRLIPTETVDVRPEGRSQNLSFMLAQSVSGISVMMLMFGLVACGSTLLRERSEGTLQRLLCSPTPRASILLGKFLFTAVIGLFQLVLLFLAGHLVFGIDVTSRPLSLLVVSTVVVIAVTSFGVLVAALARTEKQAEGISTLMILVMSAVGGAWVPIQMWDLPLVFEIATRLTLTHWAMASYQAIFWYDKGWMDPSLLTNLGVLVLFSVVASGIAVRAFQRRYIDAPAAE